MVEERVQVIGFSAAEPAAVWAIVGNFCGAWHPVIAEIRAERDERGALIRAFTAKGEETLYREQLTYRSDTDLVLAYTHLTGIAGVERYDARLQVFAGEASGSRIEWSAQLSASAERALAIAAGTRAIFEMGLAALDGLVGDARPNKPVASEDEAPALRTLFIDGNAQLALAVSPQKPGPLVLFLHGIGGGRDNWLAQLRAVAPTMRAAALDLRGYGESRLGASPSTVEAYCGDILRVADALGVQKLVLCGLSYGSWIATSFAMRYPEKLAGLVLSGGCTGLSEASVAEREAFRTAREAPLNAGKTPADFAPAVVDVLAGPNAGEAVRQALFASMAAIPTSTYRDALACFTTPPERFDFTRLTMPVLMMTGEHDRLASPAEIRGVASRIVEAAPRASVRFEVIADAGHVCNVERPEAYNRVLTEFLTEVAS
ncbi:alpha/beta fold hydrolase (plasmid) [Ensifer adhaerens]|uniref:alpha/beta fold hydrolase n=1 Tax=Ensifer adhaerens TaxID=106592 RepID=UPI001CBCE29E|nr:alpha/beta fold hydrolase [Ensifer adhaerens]MBZ7927186.1 alpha/beta fold hydrolase [Ensifer adhaerens]UAX98219.1 alpha/beta fold hydrolase [Ensifer adhaerens]UAY05601.1 alpha/beta fold hydrolase [Ensifer adhaerens]UAY12979.1 alpha/beta fold hydrolase [Ensifer adhaerens]